MDGALTESVETNARRKLLIDRVQLQWKWEVIFIVFCLVQSVFTGYEWLIRSDGSRNHRSYNGIPCVTGFLFCLQRTCVLLHSNYARRGQRPERHLRMQAYTCSIEVFCLVCGNTAAQRVLWPYVFKHLPLGPLPGPVYCMTGPGISRVPMSVAAGASEFEYQCLLLLYSMYVTAFFLQAKTAAVILPMCWLGYVSLCEMECHNNLVELIKIGSRSWIVGGDKTAVTHRLFWVILLTMLASCYCKAHYESLRLRLFTALEQLSQDALQQKIIRFRAEFKSEQIYGGKTHVGPASSARRSRPCTSRTKVTSTLPSGSIIAKRNMSCRDQDLDHAKGKQKTKQFRASVSWKSAPAALFSIRSECLNTGEEVCETGDCLPADSVAWVQHLPFPKPLSDIRKGQKVLCYDHVGGCMNYVDVTDTHVDTGAKEWVKVVLQDGTALGMTADHPIAQQDLENHAASPESVPASELLPGYHTMMVLKMVPVVVERVEKIDVDDDPAEVRTRVSLAVKQPQRHSIFVAASAQEPTMAVGANNVRPPEFDLEASEHGLEEGAVAQFRRANSEPILPMECRREPSELGPALAAQQDGASETMEDMLSKASSTSSLAHIRETRLAEVSITLAVPDAESADDEYSPSVKFPGTVAKLSQLMKMQALGFGSFGSRKHGEGLCEPCGFYKKTGFCRRGLFCSFCHESSHADVGDASRQKSLRTLAAELANGDDPSQEVSQEVNAKVLGKGELAKVHDDPSWHWRLREQALKRSKRHA